jgi:hypothetical protein
MVTAVPNHPGLQAVPKTPPLVERPAFARWIWERDLDLREVGEAIGCSYEHVRRMCLPFADPARKVPTDERLLRAIVAYTGGEIGIGDFYPADLRPVTGPERGGDATVLRHGRST